MAHRFPLQQRHPNTFSTGSTSSEEYVSKELNRMSTLESSGNENNKRVDSSSGHRRVGSGETNNDSSTITHTGTAGAPNAVFQSKARSSSTPRPPQRSSSSGKRDDEESVIIEEKRKKVNGDGYTLHRYLRGRLLGKGGFAKVYHCTALDNNKSYAVKIVPKVNLVKARARQKLQAEIKIHRTLKHKHICEYKHFFEDRTNCYILLELCHNQSMNEMIKRRKRLTEPEAAYFMRQLLQAVDYLHEERVIHRDLKLGNLFLDRRLLIKVGDLGLATRLEKGEEKRKTICGTPNYIAPEVIQGDKQTRGHSFEVDIWSMGVILYTVLVGKPPYEAKDVKATYQRILANEYSFPSHINISPEAKDLVSSMLQTNPEKRPKLDQIAQHAFLTSQTIPKSLPSNATHYPPRWRENELRTEASCADTISEKLGLPRSNPSRKPLASRDPNSERVKERSKCEKTEKKDTVDVQSIFKGALEGANAVRNALQPAFQIFDEAEPKTASKTPTFQVRRKVPLKSPSYASAAEEQLAKQTAALSLHSVAPAPRDSQVHSVAPTPRDSQVPSVAPTPRDSQVHSVAPTPRDLQVHSVAPTPRDSHDPQSRVSDSAVDVDSQILYQMLDRIATVTDITEARKYSYHASTPKAVGNGGPTTWVTRYVDYTSKYGLGFLLNDGSSGVYFNDSTKTVLEAEGEAFLYVERRRSSSGNGSRHIEPVKASYTLTSFPKSLQKKVTLLKHFRNYLIEQQKAVEDESEALESANAVIGANLFQPIYLKKWVRTKHAILFRLSDQTVQIVFFDQTEILLTPDERFVTYIDKSRKRQTFHLNDELVGTSMELAKRLKYTKEILQQLVSGHRR